MTAPFYPQGAFGDLASLGVAVGIGIAFGFVLERAGFGSSRKLVSQFYLDDLAVFKVMFTAIATAMLGLYGLGKLGVLDRTQIALVPTNLWPELVGGLVLGAGFVIGGWCPGTSIVGMATGRLDALAFVAGVAGGTFVVGEAQPLLKDFLASGDLGSLTLPQALHLPEGVVVTLVLAVAIAGMFGARWVEHRFAGTESGG